MNVEIIPAQLEHIPFIITGLREELPPTINSYKIIKEEMEGSTRAYSGFIDDEIACMWGIHARTILNDSVYLWLLTTKLVEDHPFVFVRHSQMVARELLKSYSRIEGWVWEKNTLSIKWLRWLGCELAYLEPGVLGFELRRA
jgi:hypothetical protein